MSRLQTLLAEIQALDERMYRNGLAIMTRRLRTRLLNYRARIQKRGQTFDETAWQGFLRWLYPEEQRFLRRYFAEVREELARAIDGTPLAETIAQQGGRWPWPKGWCDR